MEQTISAGAIGLEVGLQREKLLANMNDLERYLKTKAAEFEKIVQGIRPNIQNHLLKKTLSEVHDMHNALKKKLEEKISLNADMASIQRTKSALDAVAGSLEGIEKEGSKLKSSGGFNLQQIFAFGASAAVARGLYEILDTTIETTAEFENLQTRLVSLYGDVGKAKAVFEQFNQVAETTPYSLKEVVEAGATLKAFGVDAESSIKPVSDLAAYMGINVVEAASAFGRAMAGGVGAADILRERGVLNLVKSFKGIDDITKLTLPEFRKVLMETLVDPTAGIIGSTDRLSKTYQGALSNMRDQVDKLKVSFGELFVPLLTEFFPKATEWIRDFTRRVKELTSGRGANASSGVAFDFTGTTPGQRHNMISNWERDIAQAEENRKKARSKRENYAMNTYGGMLDRSVVDELKQEEAIYEAQIGTYRKLIQLAKDYKEVKTKSGGEYDSEKAKQAAAEKLEQEKKYYDSLRYISAGFVDYKLQEIEREIATMKKSGLTELDFEAYKTEKKKQIFDDYIKYVTEKAGLSFDENGQLKNGKAVLPLQFTGKNKLSGAKGISKPSIDAGSDAAILEEWINQSEASTLAFDTMFNSFYEGLSQIKIRTSETATALEKIFANMANIVIAEIEKILAKWAVLNLFAAIGGAPGVGILSVLGINEKTVRSSTDFANYNNPIASLQSFSFNPRLTTNNNFSDAMIVQRLDRLIGGVDSLNYNTIKSSSRNSMSAMFNNSNIIKALAVLITQEQKAMQRGNYHVD